MKLCTERAERIHLVAGSTHLCAERREGRQELPQPGLHGGELKCGVGSGGGGAVAGHLGVLRGGGAAAAAETRLVAHLREVGDGFEGLYEDRAAGAGARAAAVRKVHPRGLATRSARRA